MDKPALIANLRSTADLSGVKVTEKGPGHFHLQGACLVNYYPFSKASSAFVAGRDTVKHVSVGEAVAMALETPPEAPPPATYWTLFGRPVTEEEWYAFQMPEGDVEGPPWSI